VKGVLVIAQSIGGRYVLSFQTAGNKKMLLPVLGKNLFIFLNTDFNYVWVEHLLTSFQVKRPKTKQYTKV